MKSLLVLRFDDNMIVSIEPLTGLTDLRRVMGNDNKIKSLDPLKNLKGLKTIDFCNKFYYIVKN